MNPLSEPTFNYIPPSPVANLKPGQARPRIMCVLTGDLTGTWGRKWLNFWPPHIITFKILQ